MTKIIKKIIPVCVILLSLVVLSACSSSLSTKKGNAEIKSGYSADADTSKRYKTGKGDSGSEALSNSGSSTGSESKSGSGSSSGSSSKSGSGSSSDDRGSSGSTTSSAGSVQQETKAQEPAPQETQTQAPTPEYIITITVDAQGYGGVQSALTLSFSYQPSVYDALCNCGVSVEGSGSYITAINGLREKEHGSMSGWLYSVNGTTPMASCGSYYLNSGDNVYWYYQGE